MYEKADFPPSRGEYGVIRIPRLSPIVRGVVDRPSFSFGAYMTERPGGPARPRSIAGSARFSPSFASSNCACSWASSAPRWAAAHSAASMPFEADQLAHLNAELPDLLGAAELRQIDDGAGRQHIGGDTVIRSLADTIQVRRLTPSVISAPSIDALRNVRRPRCYARSAE